jgi:MtN3 and saliva related transmembrane protein
MTWNFWEYWALAAGSLAVIAVLIQIVKTLRTKDVTGISAGMYLTFTLGLTMWIVYAVSNRLPGMLVVNCVLIAENLTMLFLKWRYRPRD